MKKYIEKNGYTMIRISETTTPFVLKECFYADQTQCESRDFLLLESRLPSLIFSEEEVPVTVSPTDAVYFQNPDRVKAVRFIYSKFFAEKSCEIIFSTISHSEYKIWLNRQYVGACTGFSLFAFYLTLKKGINEIVFEVNLANPDYYDFNNRVELCPVAEADPQSLFYHSVLEYDRWIQFFHTADCRKFDCTCLFIPRRYTAVDSASIRVIDDFGILLGQLPALPGVPVTFEASKLKQKSPNTIRIHLFLEVTFTDGTTTNREQVALLCDYEDEKRALALEYDNALSIADEYTKNFLINEYGTLLKKMQCASQKEATALFRLKKCLRHIENNKSPYYATENNALIYYCSTLDLQYRKIRICKPLQLSTKHPGLIVFINVAGNSDGTRVKHLLKEHSDLIIVDLNVAGFSTGTPISEALISEAMDEVRKLYAFDERRIYWYGFCNNGSAAWNFCQNHPHLATKIVSTEAMPDVWHLYNLDLTEKILYNWSIYNSKKFHRLSKCKSFQLTQIHNSTHNYMQYYLYRIQNFQNLDHILPEFPRKVCFRTERMRFNQSYWITLNSIRKTKSKARITATIEDRKTITVQIINSDDFTIKVSPQMETDIRIVINGVTFFCKKQESIRFVRKRNRFCISKEQPVCSSRKGTGLLDVYYGPLRIIHDGSNTTESIAQNSLSQKHLLFLPS